MSSASRNVLTMRELLDAIWNERSCMYPNHAVRWSSHPLGRKIIHEGEEYDVYHTAGKKARLPGC